MIKLIIFDVYGLVLNEGYPNTCKALAKRFNRDWQEIFEVLYIKYFNLAAERKITQVQAWQAAVKELKLPIKWQEVRELHYSLMKLQPAVISFAKKLKKDYKVILLSKNTRSQLADAKKRLNFWQPFDCIVNTWEYGLPKASQKTMRYLTKRFKVGIKEMVYIDDQENNLKEARAMGVKTILYQNLSQLKKELKKIL